MFLIKNYSSIQI